MIQASFNDFLLFSSFPSQATPKGGGFCQDHPCRIPRTPFWVAEVSAVGAARVENHPHSRFPSALAPSHDQAGRSLGISSFIPPSHHHHSLPSLQGNGCRSSPGCESIPILWQPTSSGTGEPGSGLAPTSGCHVQAWHPPLPFLLFQDVIWTQSGVAAWEYTARSCGEATLFGIFELTNKSPFQLVC